jgi:hypothetical protein
MGRADDEIEQIETAEAEAREAERQKYKNLRIQLQTTINEPIAREINVWILTNKMVKSVKANKDKSYIIGDQ